MTIQQALHYLLAHHDLDHEQMQAVMQQIMSGQATDAQIAGFLIALRMKGETVTEITAAAQVMHAFATLIELQHPHLIDIVGTGGDKAHTFNISTASAIVTAAAGGVVAKHGNRSVSSQSGSADVLQALGVNLELTPEQVQHCIQQIGIGFLFAPKHHPAMHHAMTARKQLGVRTVFNLLGPLTNPASVQRCLIGVYDLHWLLPIAQVLQALGCIHALVVHAQDGLDEISINATTDVAELKDNNIRHYTITPEQFGLRQAPLSSIQVDSPEQSVTLIQQVLNNQAGPARDIIHLNAGAAIYVAGLTDSLEQGIVKADQVLATGTALTKLQQLINITNI